MIFLTNMKAAPIDVPIVPPNRHMTHLTNISLFLFSVLPIALSAIMSTNGTLSDISAGGLQIPFISFCPVKILTGFNCPFCGMTRCFIYLSHLQLAAAWRMNPAGLSVYLLCLFEGIFRGISLVKTGLTSAALFKRAETALLTLCIAAVAVNFVWQFIRLL